MNAAMVAALASSDEATQQTEWAKAQDLILADMPSVPIVSGKTPAAGQTYVKGFVALADPARAVHRRLARQVSADG